jgi:hypothetical protein
MYSERRAFIGSRHHKHRNMLNPFSAAKFGDVHPARHRCILCGDHLGVK